MGPTQLDHIMPGLPIPCNRRVYTGAGVANWAQIH